MDFITVLYSGLEIDSIMESNPGDVVATSLNWVQGTPLDCLLELNNCGVNTEQLDNYILKIYL